MAVLQSFLLLETVVDDKNFEQDLLNEFKNELNRILHSVLPSIKGKVDELIRIAIKNSPEYAQMQPGGVLYGQIGRPDINKIVDNIIDMIIDESQIVLIPAKVYGNQVQGAIEVNILNLNYDKVLSIDGTEFISENNYPVSWLSWLLLEGDVKIITNFRYLPSEDFSILHSKKINSRTGEGIMKRSRRGWGFPAEYSGTQNDNWLTRSVDTLNDQILPIMEKEISFYAN